MPGNNTFRPLDEKYGWAYEYVQFTLATGQTNYDVKANHPTLFGGVWSPYVGVTANPAYQSDDRRTIARIITDKKVWLKFNSTTYPEIIVESSESPFVEVNLLITNIFLTSKVVWNTVIGILLYK